MNLELLLEINRIKKMIFSEDLLRENSLVGGLSDELVGWIIKQSDELISVMGKNADTLIKLSKNFNGASISDQISIIKTIMSSLPESQIIKFSKSFLSDTSNYISKNINDQISSYNEYLLKYPNLTKDDVISVFKGDLDLLFKGSDESLNKLTNQIKKDALEKIYKPINVGSTIDGFYKIKIGDGSKIDFSKIVNAKNLNDYKKIIDDAISTGDFSKISKGGFESYGIDNFRVHLMKNYPPKSVDVGVKSVINSVESETIEGVLGKYYKNVDQYENGGTLPEITDMVSKLDDSTKNLDFNLDKIKIVGQQNTSNRLVYELQHKDGTTFLMYKSTGSNVATTGKEADTWWSIPGFANWVDNGGKKTIGWLVKDRRTINLVNGDNPFLTKMKQFLEDNPNYKFNTEFK